MLVSLLLCLSATLRVVQNHTVTRGVWMTISGTQDPYSVEGINNAVYTCHNVGINTIYFSVWDQSMINFFSSQQLFDKYEFLKINPRFKIDPLKTLIQIAKPLNISVVAWFQYGFATAYADPTGGPILQARTQWISRNQQGDLTSKNNFYWMNGFHPEVQDFITDLFKAVIQKYMVDGVQGDDRLPAMPSNAGYDDYTVQIYKQQHQGRNPPTDEKQQNWINWRCNILNNFLERLYTTIKQINPAIKFHMSPSVYPWSKYEYLQDWPSWVSNRYIDYVIPQIYRYDIKSYESTLKANLKYTKQSNIKLYAGVLIGLGSNTTVNAKNLEQTLQINRNLNISGQVFFYHESLKDASVQNILKQYQSQLHFIQ